MFLVNSDKTYIFEGREDEQGFNYHFTNQGSIPLGVGFERINL